MTCIYVCCQLFLLLIDDYCCNVIKETDQRNKERFYYLTNDRFNGKRYYTYKNHIIWYMKILKSWAIGYTNHLGTYYINSFSYESCPDKVNYWYYRTRNYTWKSSKNIIIVECCYN